MSKPEEKKSKYPPVTKPDDILDPVARFHAQQQQRIIELLENLLAIEQARGPRIVTPEEAARIRGLKT